MLILEEEDVYLHETTFPKFLMLIWNIESVYLRKINTLYDPTVELEYKKCLFAPNKHFLCSKC